MKEPERPCLQCHNLEHLMELLWLFRCWYHFGLFWYVDGLDQILAFEYENHTQCNVVVDANFGLCYTWRQSGAPSIA